MLSCCDAISFRLAVYNSFPAFTCNAVNAVNISSAFNICFIFTFPFVFPEFV
ncbi:hypothetical protein BMETH_650_0 [methanotrophic bacterial endosymbiont of Bathymodiolus sp.]|nr:hypothetical protein BMETH_650_0 [methanotrophic bacterial endosymbiont of Bathymodiolus sp.]